MVYKGILSGYIKEKGINASCVITGRLHITPNTKVGLDKHMMLHMSKKTLSFEQCEKTLTQKCVLQQHMRVHTGEGPYICQYCVKTLTISSSLRSHAQKLHNVSTSQRFKKKSRFYLTVNKLGW